MLKKISLQNFRNYADVALTFTPHLNVVWGNNGQGKSNLLEAIYLLSTGQSYRANRDQELVRWGENYFLVKSENQNKDGVFSIELAYQVDQKKNLKINGYKHNKISDILGVFNVVLFSPDDLYLVKGGPSQRRRYLDLIISRLNPAYYYHLQQYNKAVEQRNQLLRSIGPFAHDFSTLDVWDEQIVHLGAKILLRRLQVLPTLAKFSRQYYRKISDDAETLSLRYQSSVSMPGDNKNIDDYSAKKIEQYFREHVGKVRKDELKRGNTLIGPHRDDLIVYFNDHEMRSFGSQGQQRSAVLSLKMAELEILAQESGEYPVLLLDDVLSELDSSRREFLFQQLIDKVQTILTTTDYNFLSSDLISTANLIEVNNGNLLPALYFKEN